MSRKWTLTAVIVVVVAVALAAVLFLMPHKSPSASSGAGSSTVPTNTISASTQSPASTGTAGPGGRPVVTPATNPSGTTTGGAPVGRGLKPFPSVPDPHLPARDATSPAPAGETLAPLTEAPAATISGLKLGTTPEGAKYRVTMSPLGLGPSIPLGSRLVLHVDSVAPLAGAPVIRPLADANVLALMDTTHGGAVTKGGTYTATLTFRTDGTKLLPILSGVAAK